MRNPNIKVWMWQRLYKFSWMPGRVFPILSEYEWELATYKLNTNCQWLCPKPNLVLVNVH